MNNASNSQALNSEDLVPVEKLMEADALLSKGEWKLAEAAYEALYTQYTAEPNIFIGLGVANYKQGNLDVATRAFVDALFRRVEPKWLEFYLNTLVRNAQAIPAKVLLGYIRKELPDLFIQVQSAGLERQVDDACARLGILSQEDKLHLIPDESAAANKKVIEIAQLLKADRDKEALARGKEAIRRYPNSTGLRTNVGLAFKRVGYFDEALKHYFKVILLKPEDNAACSNLGNLYIEMGELGDAAAFLEAAAIAFPDVALIWSNLAAAYNQSGKMPVEAEFAARRSLQIGNGGDEVTKNTARLLGIALSRQGRGREALEAFSQGFDPTKAEAYNAPLLTMVMDDGQTAEDISRAHVVYGKKLEETEGAEFKRKSLGKAPKEPTIGFVTGDFRNHSVAYFTLPLVEALRTASCSVKVFYNNGREDFISERFKENVDGWARVRGMPDDDLVALIAREEVDVLIDLAGHTAGARLPVFMRQSAPLQLTWLGYPATTGISAITGRLTDKYADPKGTESHYVEDLIRLDGHFCAYRPMMSQPAKRTSSDYMPTDPPAVKNGFITFGSCNTLAKYSETTIRMWARVLQAVPNSKLLIESPGLQTIALKRLVLQRFISHDVSPDRIVLWPRDTQRQYLIYNLIDIALDSFPCGGGTTTFDLLWMGVPLVTLPSDRFAGRMGVSALKAIGCDSWIADSEDRYVEIAQELASDLSALTRQRASQREQFEVSALTDEHGFAERFLDGIRVAWEAQV